LAEQHWDSGGSGEKEVKNNENNPFQRGMVIPGLFLFVPSESPRCLQAGMACSGPSFQTI
jgi:hypothetical protein